jgi:hypothetical protein
MCGMEMEMVDRSGTGGKKAMVNSLQQACVQLGFRNTVSLTKASTRRSEIFVGSKLNMSVDSSSNVSRSCLSR